MSEENPMQYPEVKFSKADLLKRFDRMGKEFCEETGLSSVLRDKANSTDQAKVTSEESDNPIPPYVRRIIQLYAKAVFCKELAFLKNQDSPQAVGFGLGAAKKYFVELLPAQLEHQLALNLISQEERQARADQAEGLVETIDKIAGSIINAPPDVASAFSSAFADGLRSGYDKVPVDPFDTPRSIRFALWLHWPDIEKHCSGPREVIKFLRDALGEKAIGSDERIRMLLKRYGFRAGK